MSNFLRLAVLLALIAAPAFADKKSAPPASAPRSTVVREVQLYISPDPTSQKVTLVTPGHELAVVEKSGQWLRVFANTDIEENAGEQPAFGTDAAITPASGWILDKGVIGGQTPNGDLILFGAAAEAESAATKPHGHRAALDARLMYKRVAEYFPNSPLAGEAMWRSADIRWQLEKADAFSRPSAHEKENYLREQLNEDEMKKIAKRFPGSKWADLAAFDLIDNKICGDWQGSTKCPEKESEIYEKYAADHPAGPRTAEALYEAAWRQAVVGDMYQADADQKKADAARVKAKALAQQDIAKFSPGDYAARAATLIYKLDQQIPVYGEDHD